MTSMMSQGFRHSSPLILIPPSPSSFVGTSTSTPPPDPFPDFSWSSCFHTFKMWAAGQTFTLQTPPAMVTHCKVECKRPSTLNLTWHNLAVNNRADLASPSTTGAPHLVPTIAGSALIGFPVACQKVTWASLCEYLTPTWMMRCWPCGMCIWMLLSPFFEGLRSSACLPSSITWLLTSRGLLIWLEKWPCIGSAPLVPMLMPGGLMPAILWHRQFRMLGQMMPARKLAMPSGTLLLMPNACGQTSWSLKIMSGT